MILEAREDARGHAAVFTVRIRSARGPPKMWAFPFEYVSPRRAGDHINDHCGKKKIRFIH
jgi:hypothetical protein